MKQYNLFTSESVAAGHPDKVADQISDAILDAYIAQDDHSRVACEVMVTTGMVLVSGEISSRAQVDIRAIVRRTIAEIGYTDPFCRFEADSCCVLISIDEQSPDITMGVVKKDESKQGAGDQGMMFGFACDETPEFMPLPIVLSNALIRKLNEIRNQKKVDYLRPDGKAQVTVIYDGFKPVRIGAVVLSTQHNETVSIKQLRKDMKALVIDPVLPKKLVDAKMKIHINPTGRFVLGGPHADTGLTGRKIIVDTYGGVGRHGGGAFSGKDPSKVDRSASYAARWVAKNVVAAGLASRCEIQLAYAIGICEPVSVRVETFGTETIPVSEIESKIRKVWDLTPYGIIRDLKLRRPIYRKTAAYGHFGRNEPEFTWEKLDRVKALKG
ncbi:MAG: methionine adenosyltransferase [Candidatus Eisenbacteria bacterium]|uniref:S-adenosylmethionine synthase n=1 Tax=Eiseniibacteriota bacterium TaxID=2212470 RepID=A0A948RUS4_UNCEI|nr:methionine adenosyltransferase [Candidatus Eisenbacteria bacterium]MBU1950127.1 methionine adenosyltransferase [Candidatus Eisenbacteria bacterium]MBU2689837.1 methionine adenosyltransferase [Candidatus Eisenbacteria bacterium]